MAAQYWRQTKKKNLVCIDAYDDGILRGRIYSPAGEPETFASLSQFLIRMEQLLEKQQTPQSYTVPRRFADVPGMETAPGGCEAFRRGEKATFELQILFRQHTSWQGVLLWREENLEHSFRSVLELILLLDSALRRQEAGMERAV